MNEHSFIRLLQITRGRVIPECQLIGEHAFYSESHRFTLRTGSAELPVVVAILRFAGERRNFGVRRLVGALDVM